MKINFKKTRKEISLKTSHFHYIKDKFFFRTIKLKAPYTFLTLIKSVCPSCVNDDAHELTFWLLWFNSTLNPILYPFLHVKFRKAFLRILHSIFFCFEFKKTVYKATGAATKSRRTFGVDPSHI